MGTEIPFDLKSILKEISKLLKNGFQLQHQIEKGNISEINLEISNMKAKMEEISQNICEINESYKMLISICKMIVMLHFIVFLSIYIFKLPVIIII